MWPLWIKYIIIMAFIVVDGDRLKPARQPVVPGNPFSVFWNAPTDSCQKRYKVNLELALFGIVSNPNESLSGPAVTIFYSKQLGYYPYVDNLIPINGGVPQNLDLHLHLTKAKSDIENTIPAKMFNGLAVIDWERWRPMWRWNEASRTVYRNLSINLVQNRHPNWHAWRIVQAAKKEFEEGAKNLMNSTIFLAKTLRPHGLWGFYHLPECQNYANRTLTYRGLCPKIDIKSNDLLSWVWKQSNALFPSIFIQSTMKSNPKVVDFVQNRVMEALRVATRPGDDYDLPVFVYLMPVYVRTNDVLTEEDLVSTIGESASLGAAGVVLWGNTSFGRSKDMCRLLKNYLAGPLGKYIVNVTTAAKYCSQHICSNNGKCIRRYNILDTYLHLPSHAFKIKVITSYRGKKMSVRGKLNSEEIKDWKTGFKCQCYPGWGGLFCEIPCSYKTKEVWH